MRLASRTADGTLTSPTDYPGASSTLIFGLNDAGLMVGDYGTISFERFGRIVQT